MAKKDEQNENETTDEVVAEAAEVEAAVEEDAAEIVAEVAEAEDAVEDAVAEGEIAPAEGEVIEDAVAEAAVEAVAEDVEAAAEVDEAVEEVVAEEAAEDVEAAVSPPAGSDTAPSTEAGGEAAAATKRKKKRLPRALRPARPKRTRAQGGERKPIVRLPKPDDGRGRRQERQGKVVSSAMDKTIVVKVDVMKAHPRYKKVVRRSVKFHAHDEGNQAKVGDIVRIVETRPLSATKRWRLVEIVEAAK
jgi:small subunit ribosomal protein S17